MGKLTKAERWIIRALSEGALTSNEVASKVELHRVYILKILKKLSDEGLLTKVAPPPLYSASDAGKAALASKEEES